MDIEKIRQHVEEARKLLAKMGGGSLQEEMKLFQKFAFNTEAAKAELSRANLRSEDQVFIRDVIVGHIKSLEMTAMGDAE